MKKEDIKIGDRVITDVYFNLGDLIVVMGTVTKIYDKYCSIVTDSGYTTSINLMVS